MSKKLSLKLKVLIASGLIAAGVGASYGAVWAYAQNSDEVKGSFPPFSKEALKNNYASIKEEGVLTPQLGILDPLKEKKVADLNEDATEFWFLNKPEERMDLDTFFQKYYEIYQEGFILEVKYASFSFFDEYVLAVRPKQFIDFSKWFMTNVAWGPDILTLESFRIVKGAEQRGNSITLGSHSTDKKESSEIKFFPDAFFGSLPIFSSYSGRGLAPDALTYSTFTKSVDLKTLEEYLNNIPLASAIMNSNHTEYTDSYDTSATRDKRPNLELFQGLLTPGRLIGQKFIVYKNDSPEHLKNITISEKEKVAQGLLLVLPYDITKGEFEDLKKANPKIYDQVQFSDFEPAIIKNVKKQALVDPAGKVTPISMKLDFEFTNDREERSKEFSHYYKEVPETLFDMQSLGVYRNLVESQIVNFLDFYDVNNFVGSELYVYHKDGKNYFYKSWAEAENSLKLNGAGENALYKITKFNKVKVGDDFVLYAHLKNIKNNSENADQSELILQFNSGETRIDKKLEFFQFKQAIGYIGSIKPTTLSAGPENITLKDEKGNPIRGLASRDYQLYTEVYSGLIDILTAKYPHLLKDLNGPHVEQTLNKEGYYTYKVVDGPYKGMSDGDRIGLPLVLNALIENYEGISTDFLKYVGAHEYGHHYTLEGTQSLNNQKNSVVVGGLNTRGGVNVQSYFAYDAVKNYLDARTGLEIVRVDALGNETPNGEFINFKYHKIHSDEVFNETDQDIWGTANKNDDIFDLINNKQRRFLQNYETLNEAAKLRDVKVGDLFIANSFDRHSGTLNPYIEGPMSAFNNASDLGFEKLSTERVLNIVYDGKFQKIPYEVKSNGSVDIKVIETLGKGDQMSISKINVFNSDGTPAINVPLFKVLDHASWDYVNRQVDVIKQSINNLVRANGYDSGWNQPSTILGGKPEFSLVKVLEGEKLTKWADEVKTRKDPIEKNPDYNIYGYTLENKERKGWSYLSLFSDASGNLLNWYLIRQAAYSKNFYDSLDDKLTQYKTYIKDKANTYNGYNAGINPTVYFDETHKYSFPLAKNRNSSPIYNNPDRLKSVAAQYDLPVPSGEVLYGFDYFFIAGLNQKYLGFLTSNNTLSSSPQERTSKFVWVPKKMAASFDFSTFLPAMKNLQKVRVDNVEMDAFVFDSFLDFFEFFAVDYTKFTRVGVVEEQVAYNVDLDYAKSKFDFSKLGELTGLSGNESEQEVANYLFEKFIKSPLFITIKDFNPATDLVANQAIFSSRFGIALAEPDFYNNFFLDDSLIPDGQKNFALNVEKLQNLFVRTAQEQGLSGADFNNINAWDLNKFIGNTVQMINHGINTDPYLSNMEFGKPSTGKPSSDFLNYNLTRVEPLINDKFTDYIYSLPETLTRDYVQTTYVPSFENFGNLPSYLKNVNEATTGLDYIVDATKLEGINETKIRHIDIINAQQTVNEYNKFKESIEAIFKIRTEGFNHDLEVKAKLKEIDKKIEEAKKNPDEEVARAEIDSLRGEKLQALSYLGKQAEDVAKATEEGNKKVANLANSVLSEDQTDMRESSYFGKFITNSNGYFKDRWEKTMINMNLYDDQGNPVIIPEKDRRLVSFDGTTKIDNAPEAFFVSQLLNFGVGSRTVSGIFRNKKLDALALYGYIDTASANQIKYLKFTNINNPKDIRYLPVNTTNTNNIFYLQKQGDANSKRTLEDYGYTTWISDYAYMAKYRGTLLEPGNAYYVEFANEQKQVVAPMTLGKIDTLAENGKLQSQAPIQLRAEEKDGNKTGKVIMDIDYQFNILGSKERGTND